MTRDAEALLARAEALLDAPDRTAVGNSARLAAFLARQAVEDLVDARCAVLCGVEAVVGTTKAKLAVLKSLDGTPAGIALVGAWHQLTGFCHQHAYQLSPTVAEVREQCLAVKRNCLGDSSEQAGGNPQPWQLAAARDVEQEPERSSQPPGVPNGVKLEGS